MADSKLTELTELTNPTNDDILYIVDSPGGTPLSKKVRMSSLLPLPDRYPASPKTEDDEFDGSSLDAKWTVITDSVNAKYYSNPWTSWLMTKMTGNQAYQIQQSYAPGGNFSLTLKYTYPMQENYQGVKIFAFTSDRANGIAGVIEHSSYLRIQIGSCDSSVWSWNRVYLEIGNSVTTGGYLHLQRTGDNWEAAWSTDGISFMKISSGYSKAFTVAKIEISVDQASCSIPTYSGFDWFRRDWITIP